MQIALQGVREWRRRIGGDRRRHVRLHLGQPRAVEGTVRPMAEHETSQGQVVVGAAGVGERLHRLLQECHAAMEVAQGPTGDGQIDRCRSASWDTAGGATPAATGNRRPGLRAGASRVRELSVQAGPKRHELVAPRIERRRRLGPRPGECGVRFRLSPGPPKDGRIELERDGVGRFIPVHDGLQARQRTGVVVAIDLDAGQSDRGLDIARVGGERALKRGLGIVDPVLVHPPLAKVPVRGA